MPGLDVDDLEWVARNISHLDSRVPVGFLLLHFVLPGELLSKSLCTLQRELLASNDYSVGRTASAGTPSVSKVLYSNVCKFRIL